MSPFVDAPAVPAYQITSSQATGPEAAEIAQQVTEVQRALDGAYLINRNRREALNRLTNILLEARSSQSLQATVGGSCRFARSFLRILPEEFPPPEVDLANDGEVVFEWIGGRNNRLVISFSPLGELNFAAVHPAGETKGKEYFAGAIPQPLSLALGRFLV